MAAARLPKGAGWKLKLLLLLHADSHYLHQLVRQINMMMVHISSHLPPHACAERKYSDTTEQHFSQNLVQPFASWSTEETTA